MSQTISVDVCKLRETNENEVAFTVKLIANKKLKVQYQSRRLKNEVESLQHENILLDKQISCTDSINLKLEKDINMIKIKTEEAACILEQSRWKILKTEMLKDFEIQRNESIKSKIYTNEKDTGEQLVGVSPTQINNEINNLYNYQSKNNEKNLDILKGKLVQLKEEIEEKKSGIQKTDPKLYIDIQMLEKRNGALLLRYHRQLQEAESRLRQKQYERNSLEKLLLEKNSVLLNSK